MKILWFTNTPCSADTYLGLTIAGGGWLKSLEREIRTDVELHVAFLNAERKESFRYEGVTYHPVFEKFSTWSLISNTFFRYRVYDAEFCPQFCDVIDKIKPDVVHIHGTENSFSCILGKVDVPIVFSVQGVVNAIYARHLAIDGFPKNHAFWMAQDRYKRMALIEKRALSKSKYVIAKTGWSHKIVNLLAPSAKCFCLDNIMRDSFYGTKWETANLRQTPWAISTTMSDGFLKGLDTIIQAAQVLHELKIPFIWKIAGVSERSQTVKAFRKFDRWALLGRQIRLLGRVDEQVLAESLLNSSVYVTASRIENSPNNLSEALLLGLPCIASFVGGTGDFIEDGRSGLLFAEGDFLALAGHLMTYFKDHETAREHASEGTKIAHLRHDKARIKKTLLSIYDDILIHSRGSWRA